MQLIRPLHPDQSLPAGEPGDARPQRATNPIASPPSRNRGLLSFILWQPAFAVGFCLVVFSGANLVGALCRPGFDANILCLPLAPTHWWGSRAAVAVVTALLGWSLVRPLRSPWLYVPAQALLLLVAGSAVADGIGRWCPFLRSEVTDFLPLGYLACVVAALLSQVVRIRRDVRSSRSTGRAGRRQRVAATLLWAAVVVGLFLAAQFFLLGRARQVRRADCAVVMGAGVLPSGRPSRSLRERTRTACLLYLNGGVKYLIFSGGPVYGSFTEPKSMARFARSMGVPEEAVLLDEGGNSTYDTVVNVRRMMAARQWQTALIVSHDYHLSRACLAFRRAGIAAYPLPAERSGFVYRKECFSLLRECPAWIYYFVRPLWEPYAAQSALPQDP